MPTLDLTSLAQTTVIVTADDAFPAEGHAAINLTFSDGTCISADYWRLIIEGRRALSSFDHDQRYGLPSPINAKERLRSELTDKRCLCAVLDEESGDLVFEFAPNIKLQVFNFTGYEIWTIRFADGRVHYSNYA
jgi:hypothetical protein